MSLAIIAYAPEEAKKRKDKFKSADQTKNGYKELSTQIADVLEDYYGHD